MVKTHYILPALAGVLLLAACGGSGGGGPGGGGVTPPPPPPATTRTYHISPGPSAVEDTLLAFFDAREGDTIDFAAGTYAMSTGLIMNGKRGLTIRGAGKDATILSFSGSDSAEGLNVANSDGIVLQGFTVEDTPGNGIRVFRSRFVTLRDVRARWRDEAGRAETDAGYTPRESHGAYGLYPVECEHVLIEDSEAHGASDAGVYVGQTSDVIVRRTLARFNVAGFEFENTYRAVFEDNEAYDNTGGFLVFDLPGLRQYGEKNIVRRNKSHHNNTDNFAPVGNIVGLTPRGTGMLILATDQLEIHDNEIYDNDTTGIAIVNYGLADPNQPDQKYDFFPEGLEIHDNLFRDNGGRVQEPDLARGEASLLPLILALKNGGRSAHIIWDGAVDVPRADCAMPVDADGVPLDQPNPANVRAEPRLDERGRPNFQRNDPEPACRYNLWKFDEGGNLKPENRLSIADSNRFENTQPQTLLVTPFVNAHVTSSNVQQLVSDLLVPASGDLAPHRHDLAAIQTRPLQLPFVPDPASGDARPTDAEIAAACTVPAAGSVNFTAALRYNCPRLDQYGLFTDPQDPRSTPVGGVPFELQSALFSDYASKYRVLYLPPGTAAEYRDHRNGALETFHFPTGTIIAKTFSFKDGEAEEVIETRLLIRRETARGVNWIGLPYVWRTEGGQRIAELKVQGAHASVHWDYTDPDPEVVDVTGQRVRYTGTAERYGIPASLNCVTCHGGDDREPGAAPIGLKPRNLNRSNDALGGMNQLMYLQSAGLLTGLPADFNEVERLPRWNVPGDTGELPDTPADVHGRVRAYLEVNCMHCHNGGGNASNSGLYLDSYRRVDNRYGICKKPVAAGRGSGGRLYDIVPGSAGDSILSYRVSSAEAGVRMPPIARTVVQGEVANLINLWIDGVLPAIPDDVDNEEVCTGPQIPIVSELPLPLDLLPLGDLPEPIATVVQQLLDLLGL